MLKGIFGSWSYFIWYVFYFIVFVTMTGGAIIPIYIIFFLIAFLPASERLWRWVSGVRPLRIRAEKERLMPLFEEIYNAYVEKEKATHTRKIKLYIQESMTINAFAFGRETLVLTKGSIDLLNDEALKGMIAHELGHFHNSDTKWALFAYVANFPITILLKKLRKINNGLDTGLFKFVFNVAFIFFLLVEFIGDLILMHNSREQEYQSDMLAMKWGYGEELAGALIQLYQISMEKPKSVGEMIKATHPPITKRIERLEVLVHMD